MFASEGGDIVINCYNRTYIELKRRGFFIRIGLTHML